MDLSDSDLSRIRGVLTDYCDVPEIIEQDRALYLAGMRAGIERAMKACEEWRATCDNRTMQSEGWAAAECAKSIHALLTNMRSR